MELACDCILVVLLPSRSVLNVCSIMFITGVYVSTDILC